MIRPLPEITSVWFESGEPRRIHFKLGDEQLHVDWIDDPTSNETRLFSALFVHAQIPAGEDVEDYLLPPFSIHRNSRS
jgi:hypothetical protein